jgi:hypothetical protein
MIPFIGYGKSYGGVKQDSGYQDLECWDSVQFGFWQYDYSFCCCCCCFPFLQYGGLNWGPAPWATLPVFLCLVFQDRLFWTVCPGCLWTIILLISASWVAKITGVSHRRLACFWTTQKLNNIVNLLNATELYPLTWFYVMQIWPQ